MHLKDAKPIMEAWKSSTRVASLATSSRISTNKPPQRFSSLQFTSILQATYWIGDDVLDLLLKVSSDLNSKNHEKSDESNMDAMPEQQASERSLKRQRDDDGEHDLHDSIQTPRPFEEALQAVIEENRSKIARASTNSPKGQRDEEAASAVESSAQGSNSTKNSPTKSASSPQRTKTSLREPSPLRNNVSSTPSTPNSGKRIKLRIGSKTPEKINTLSLAENDAFASRRNSISGLSTISTASSPLSSPGRSRSGSLTASTATPVDPSNSPATAFTALNGAGEPPKKRVKMTFAEKQQELIMKEIRKRERADARALKEVERREKEQQRAHREAEREIERQKKEAELEEKRKVKEAQKAEKEKENQIKEAARKQKEAEKLKKDEEKRKKERAQPKLFAFLKPSDSDDTTAVKMSTSPLRRGVYMKSTLPPAPETVGFLIPKPQTEYEKRFPSFYVHSRVKLAPITSFQRDFQAARNVENLIDSYIRGEKALEKVPAFEASILFKTRDTGLRARGKKVLPVREIMAQTLNMGGSSQPIDLTRDSQNIQVKNVKSLLKSVPYKFLSFAEDVRPPYQGTYTRPPLSGVGKLARNPLRKDLPDTDYDYDSEAEWEEPGEGEDLDSDGEEDEDMDGDDDIDGFLDDENDELANARKLAIQGDMETQSTGLCWENEKRAGPVLEVYRYRMHVLEGVHGKCCISIPCNITDL